MTNSNLIASDILPGRTVTCLADSPNVCTKGACASQTPRGLLPMRELCQSFPPKATIRGTIRAPEYRDDREALTQRAPLEAQTALLLVDPE